MSSQPRHTDLTNSDSRTSTTAGTANSHSDREGAARSRKFDDIRAQGAVDGANEQIPNISPLRV
jgi:hypothetical protein